MLGRWLPPGSSPTCEALDLANNPLGDDGVSCLSAAETATKLRSLALTATGVGAAGIGALSNATFAPGLPPARRPIG